jgi:hypothetical protein
LHGLRLVSVRVGRFDHGGASGVLQLRDPISAIVGDWERGRLAWLAGNDVTGRSADRYWHDAAGRLELWSALLREPVDLILDARGFKGARRQSAAHGSGAAEAVQHELR